jgi:hypothetical protein
VRTHRRPGGPIALVDRQLLNNQRISLAAMRRLNGLAARLDGHLTGGDLVPGAVTTGKLATDIRILRADVRVPRPAPSRTVVAHADRTNGVSVRLTRRQLVVNQRIAQEAVRRANALTDVVQAGLGPRHFDERSIVAVNLGADLHP